MGKRLASMNKLNLLFDANEFAAAFDKATRNVVSAVGESNAAKWEAKRQLQEDGLCAGVRDELTNSKLSTSASRRHR
jgi:hypothetical protein